MGEGMSIIVFTNTQRALEASNRSGLNQYAGFILLIALVVSVVGLAWIAWKDS